jgi:hypothetical protein
MPDLDVVFQFPVDVIAITPTRQEMQSTLGREVCVVDVPSPNLPLTFTALVLFSARHPPLHDGPRHCCI